MLAIEKAVPERDYEAFAALIVQAGQEEKLSGENIRQWDASNNHADNIYQRYAAFCDGRLVGYGTLNYQPANTAGRYQVWLTIDEAYRRRGFGQELYDFLLAEAKNFGANTLISNCLDVSEEYLRFAEKQGFAAYATHILSEMSLENFNFADWQEAVEKVKAQGIRFSSLADEGFTPEAQYKLYRLNTESAQDNPSGDGSWNPTFEQFKTSIIDAPWFDPSTQLLAIDGERYVGLSAVGFDDEETAFTAFTGVDKDYRGRGIALALKVIASDFAKSRGAKRLPTSNDSRNVSMLAINKKLGYQRKKCVYLLKNVLEE
jgi:RimJ/RimL family protein N-acetyltransferase